MRFLQAVCKLCMRLNECVWSVTSKRRSLPKNCVSVRWCNQVRRRSSWTCYHICLQTRCL